MVAFSLVGSLVAFLKYNITPAKIFMGDTGALLLGLVCSILIIKFIELHRTIGESPFAYKAAPSMAVAILILPLFDTLRVFLLRILKGKSPFHPDRSHIHHLMIDVGLSHMQATSILIAVNLVFIFVAAKLQHIGNLNLLILILVAASGLSFWLYFYAQRKKINKPQ